MSTPSADPPRVPSANPTKTIVVRFRLPYLPASEVFLEIGRASCRERV